MVERPLRSGDCVASFAGKVLAAAGERAVELILEGVAKTAESRTLRISLRADSARPVVAGSLFTYGEGPVDTAEPDQRFFPLRLTLDITEAARQVAGARQVDLFVDLLDAHGRKRADESLSIHQLEIRTVPDE